jgi:hypothetical protein
VLGALIDRFALPFMSRDVAVMYIQGTKGKGCEGFAGTTYLRLGRPYGQADGQYQLTCGEWVMPVPEVQLYCDCR